MSAYATVVEGDAYIAGRLDHDIWDAASPDDKLRALVTATRLMDRLNYAGSKANADQALEFPRGTDTDYPQAIKDACVENAFALLDAVDVELEYRSIASTGVAVASAKNFLNPALVAEWRAHGIPSAIAWGLLKPFLRDPGELKISRVN